MAQELIIGDHTPFEHPDLNAGFKGLVPRDLKTHPVGYSAVIPPSTIKVFTRDVMVQMIADQERSKSRISDILLRGDGNGGVPIPSLDQNGQGYCWAYGTCGALQAARAKMGLPYKRLSPHAVGCKVKGFRDEGGWGALSLEYIATHGVPDVDHWKEKSMSRSNDTPETWANALLYRPDTTFADLASPVYDRNLSFDQQLTMLLLLNSCSDDYDWWGHCVMACDAVNGVSQRGVTRMESGKMATTSEFELVWGINDPVTGGLAKRIRNSWTDSYGDRGFAVLTGSKAVANNSVAIVTANVA